MNAGLKQKIVNFLSFSASDETQLLSLEGLGQRGWKRLIDWTDLAGLTLSFWDRIRKPGLRDLVPLQLQTLLDRNLADHQCRMTAMLEEFDTLNRSLDSAGVAYAALKGFALVPDYVPDATLRPFYDFDYLMPRASSELADRVFAAAGYVQKSKKAENSITYFRPEREARLPSSRHDLYSTRLHRTIDVHFGLWEFESLGLELDVPPRPLTRSRLRVWQGICFSVLSEEDQLLFQVLHTFQHILNNWCRLRWLLDIAGFLDQHSQDPRFWARFRNLLQRDPQLLEIASVVLGLSARLFGVQLPAELPLSLSPELQHWVERYGLTSALDNFARDKYTLFLHQYFVREPEFWRRLRNARLFPTQRPVQVGKPSGPGVTNRAVAHWTQAHHVAGRVLHHLAASAQYGWESLRWRHERSRLRHLPPAAP